MKKERVDVHEIISETIQAFSSALQQRNGFIEFTSSAKSHYVNADKLHFMNALFNLFDNAIKYCQQSPVIQVNSLNTSDRLCIEVKDNGIGISDQHVKRIFQKFYRVPSGNVHNVKGFGIGLSYVNAVVKAHGGKVTVKSKFEKGSVFSIYLKAIT
jgi:two-component system phosphate regulon sensor histidine kinase PhoR